MRRCSRMTGSASRKIFTSASGKTFVPMSRPSITTPPSIPSSRFRYIGLAHAPGDISSIQQHMISTQAWLQLDARFVGEFGESGFIIERDVPFNRLQRQSPVHGAAFEVCVAQLARQPGCDGALSSASRAVNGDDQFSGGIGHDRVRLYTESF